VVQDASTTARPSNASAAARRADAHTARTRGALCLLLSVLTSHASPTVLANSGGCAKVYNAIEVRPAADASSSPQHVPIFSSPAPSTSAPPLLCSMAGAASANGRAERQAQMAHTPFVGGLPSRRRRDGGGEGFPGRQTKGEAGQHRQTWAASSAVRGPTAAAGARSSISEEATRSSCISSGRATSTTLGAAVAAMLVGAPGAPSVPWSTSAREVWGARTCAKVPCQVKRRGQRRREHRGIIIPIWKVQKLN
jgi:hypothetical protein